MNFFLVRIHGRHVIRSLSLMLGMTVCSAQAESNVTETETAALGEAGRAYVGKIKLPSDGLWTLEDPIGVPEASEVYLRPSEPGITKRLGRRMYAALEERQVQSERWDLRAGYEQCRKYAADHDGRGPSSLVDLFRHQGASDPKWRWGERSSLIRQLRDRFDEEQLQGPFVHLIPDVDFRFRPLEVSEDGSVDQSQRRVVESEGRELLAFQLRPFINDGKHWVLFSDGGTERVEIDSELIRREQVEIVPITEGSDAEAKQPSIGYQIVLIGRSEVTSTIELNVFNQILGESTSIRWDTESATQVSAAAIEDAIQSARDFTWKPYHVAGGGGVLSVWRTDRAEPVRNPRSQLSMFSVLGGRAAIEETLQLQNINVIESDEDATVDVASLKGVEVKSHPFDEMLGDAPGGTLDIAKNVPADRFFVYVGKPAAIPALLDSGAPFIASMGTAITGNCLRYNLESKYLSRLGMSRDWLDQVLSSGMIKELAVFAPDLFFIDGTDVTVVARLKQPQLVSGLFGALGVQGLDSGEVIKLPSTKDAPAYCALRKDLLFMSTNRGELDLALDLQESNGAESLGTSTEFRYMLTKMEISDATRFYAYLSDPFIRRLTSPAVKIGQRRRMIEKAKMETIAGKSLLAKLNGKSESQIDSFLSSKPSDQRTLSTDGLSMSNVGIVRSEKYGSLGRMRSLRDVPIEKVTPAEAEAYRIYNQNYSRYWRRFFDPIAVRLDEVGDRQLELATFILPLIDNSIYNGLRELMEHEEAASPLLVPVVEPKPILQFSVNLNEQAWRMIAGNFSDFFERYSGASPEMLDDFGPGAHVAIFDADPVIAMGSGDLFGSFGGDLMRGRGNQMLMLPVGLSMLTRPCSIMVETQSPERTAQYLRQAALSASGTTRRSGFFAISFYQVDDRDEWVWTLDALGVLKLRYGIEVVGKYMVIRNIPWSSDDRVISMTHAPLDAAVLRANPGACDLQLPGLFAAAADGSRRATMAGLARLYPLMLHGSKDVERAKLEHQRLFGFYPAELPGDQWVWQDNRLVSREYGHPLQQRQPAFDPGKTFGLLNRVESLELNMQFEDDGLRSTVKWRLR